MLALSLKMIYNIIIERGYTNETEILKCKHFYQQIGETL